MITWDVPPKPAIIVPAEKKLLRPRAANFIPGMFPGGIVAAASAQGGLTTISFQDSSSSTAETITAPASIDAGDLLVFCDFATQVFSAPAAVTPSGFTNFVNASAGGAVGVRGMISYKIADGTEDSSSITGMNGNNGNYKVLLQFRGNVAISSVTANVIGTPTVTSGDPSSQNLAASGGTVPLVAIAYYSSSGNIAGARTFSPAADAELNADDNLYVKYKLYDNSPADHTVDMDDEGNNNLLISFYLEAA